MPFRNELDNFFTLFVEKISWWSDNEAGIGPNFRALARYIVVHKVFERVNNIFDVRQEPSMAQFIIERSVVYSRSNHIWADRIQCDAFSREVFSVTTNEPNDAML